MKKSILFDLFKLIALFGLIWAGFTFFPIFTLDKNDFELSVEKEEKLGKLIVEDILENDGKTKLLNNPKVDSAMAIITKRLVENIGLTDYEYKIKVIDSPEINAFTLPGGNIFVYSGLLEFSEHPEEVAAVLSHEIGHAEKKHVIQKLAKELGLTILFSAITGGDRVILGEISRTAASTVFDRGQEKEADDYSFSLMEKAKINPVALATFFRRINAKGGSYNENLELLMTHPNNNSRIKAALEYKVASGFKIKEFDIDWQAVKASLKKESNPK